MIFNILLFDDVKTFSKLDTLFSPIQGKEVLLVEDIQNAVSTFQSHSIHTIILNPKTISLTALANIFDKYNLNYKDIPIFVLLDDLEVYIENDSMLVYDIININQDDKFIFNKIKFCHHLYQKELEHESNIKQLLYIDNLTKLPNRTKLIKDVQNDSIGIVSLAIIDINSFKEINDFFGHKIGDYVLKEVALIIENTIKSSTKDTLLYKFPSDTYCLANTALLNDEFLDIITKIIKNISSYLFTQDQHEIDVRVTAGITFSTRNNKLITADLALQSAKEDHKEYLVFYDELDNLQEYQNNMIWTKKLKNALEKDNVIVYFQPLVNNQTMKVDKYECLVRMIDGDKIVSPFFFLEVSKKANLYSKITKTVIKKSFKEFENLPFEFSVNVSYEDIEDPTFLTFIKEQLNIYNISKKVVWEILEDEGIKNYDVLLEFIDEVKALGCKVAIDDFGSGYSNFEHLLKMNVDYLKIDASLIKHVATDENSYQVVKTVMEFAKSLNLKTIAEYVENEEIFKITKELGASYSQGYYFAPPVAKPNLYNF